MKNFRKDAIGASYIRSKPCCFLALAIVLLGWIPFYVESTLSKEIGFHEYELLIAYVFGSILFIALACVENLID